MSYSDANIQNEKDYISVTIKFDLDDIGKLMWLYVDFNIGHFLIPLTYGPILDPDNLLMDDLNTEVGLFDFEHKNVTLSDLLFSNGLFTL